MTGPLAEALSKSLQDHAFRIDGLTVVYDGIAEIISKPIVVAETS